MDVSRSTRTGVAINRFPADLDPAADRLSNDVHFENVRVIDQRAFVNEVLALDADSTSPSGTAAIDPVGAVFQVWNEHPRTSQPLTISDLDPEQARYTGNPVANSQALVAKAILAGDNRIVGVRPD